MAAFAMNLTAGGDANSCGSSFRPLACGLPIPGEKLVQLMAFSSPGDVATTTPPPLPTQC